jgi:hypothetical protein
MVPLFTKLPVRGIQRTSSLVAGSRRFAKKVPKGMPPKAY